VNATHWSAKLSLPVSATRDHVRGPVDAPVTLVEYGDYECPFCAAAHGVVNAIHAQMGDRLCFVFRHFPLTTVHPHAQRAAEAAEEGASQGRFWTMHDVLFENQDCLTDDGLLGYARAVRLNLERFRENLIRHLHLPRVREDFMSGVRSGVNGTPSFYINGIRHDGAWDYPTLSTVLQQRAVLANLALIRDVEQRQPERR
jgi:protein-disulfide isomerase